MFDLYLSAFVVAMSTWGAISSVRPLPYLMTKFASHILFYAVYICQKSLNFVYAFKCYQQKC